MQVHIHKHASRDAKAGSDDYSDLLKAALGTVTDVYADEAHQAAEDKRKVAYNKRVGATADALLGGELEAKARPLYAGFPLSSKSEDDLAGWAAANGFALPYWPHVTVAYSKAPVNWSEAERMSEGLVVHPGGRSIEQFGDDIVLCLDCPELQKRWERYKDMGASWDYPSYRPHITLMRNTALQPWMKTLVYDEPITLGAEKLAELVEKFHSDVSTPSSE